MTKQVRIRFEEPPPRAHRSLDKTKHEQIADKLRKHPGQWARIMTYTSLASANSVAHQIRRGKLKAYATNGTFEAVCRTVDGNHRVWARYIGPDRDQP